MYAFHVADGAATTLPVCRNARIAWLPAYEIGIWILVAGNPSSNVYI
jgi:hypothetical protein